MKTVRSTRMRHFNWIYPILLLFVVVGCTSSGGQNAELAPQIQNGVTIEGRVNYPFEKRFFIESLNDQANAWIPYDTVQLADDYTFKHFVELESPGYFRLNFTNRQLANVILHKDDLHIIADGNSRSGFIEISGSTELEQIRALNEYMQSEFVTREQNINQQFMTARQTGNIEESEKLQTEFMELREEKELALLDQIRNLGTSLASIQMLGSIDRDKNYEFFKETVAMLSTEYPEEPNLKNMRAEVERLAVLAIGQPAPEIELPNPDGQIVKLSSLKGKIVLLDFWAEWCKPCRAENPNIVKAYKKYNSSGFEVFGVSLDRTRDKWLKAINDDGLHWTQVSDLKYWNSEAAKTYNVKAIPMSFLLDENGVIIAKNLRGPALDQKLQEIFGQS